MRSQIEHFLKYLAEEHYAANTGIAYQADLAQLLEYLEQRSTRRVRSTQRVRSTRRVKDNATWKQVTEQDIRNYLLYLKERGYALSTMTRKKAAVSSFFRFLVLQGVISDNPTSNISLSRVDRSLRDVLPKEEVEQLLAPLAQDQTPRGLRDQVLLGLMVQAGFRPGELVALDLDDVEALSSQLSSQGHASLQAALERYVREGRPNLATSEEESALFLSMKIGAGGGRLTRQGMWLIVKERAEACGLERRVSPRSLRRTHLAHSQEG